MRDDLKAADAAESQAHWTRRAVAAAGNGNTALARIAVRAAIKYGAEALNLVKQNRLANLVSEAQRELVWMDDTLRQEEALDALPRADR